VCVVKGARRRRPPQPRQRTRPIKSSKPLRPRHFSPRQRRHLFPTAANVLTLHHPPSFPLPSAPTWVSRSRAIGFPHLQLHSQIPS
jgi:hypothetical protein